MRPKNRPIHLHLVKYAEHANLQTHEFGGEQQGIQNEYTALN
jgi:hypothetical protein